MPRGVAAVELDDEARDRRRAACSPRTSGPGTAGLCARWRAARRGSAARRRPRRAASGAAACRAACRRSAPANSLWNVIAHGTSVGLPKQQPAKRQPIRPMTWPSAMPGANTSVTVHIGMLVPPQVPERHQRPRRSGRRRRRPPSGPASCSSAGFRRNLSHSTTSSSSLAPTSALMMIQMPRSMTRFGSRPRARARTSANCRPEQIGGGQQHAVGVDREAADLKQDGMHGCRPRPIMSSRTRIGADRDRRVRDVERPEVRVAPVDVDEVDDVADDRAVDEVAEGAAEDQRQPEPRQPLVEARAASRRRRWRPGRCRRSRSSPPACRETPRR